jgi:hypothetical protein
MAANSDGEIPTGDGCHDFSSIKNMVELLASAGD